MLANEVKRQWVTDIDFGSHLSAPCRAHPRAVWIAMGPPLNPLRVGSVAVTRCT